MRGGQAVGGLGKKLSKEEQRKRGWHRSAKRQEMQFRMGAKTWESRQMVRKSETDAGN